jgi:hypothetical protein
MQFHVINILEEEYNSRKYNNLKNKKRSGNNQSQSSYQVMIMDMVVGASAMLEI